MFYLYIFFALFFAAVLVGMGVYEFRKADAKKEAAIAERCRREALR